MSTDLYVIRDDLTGCYKVGRSVNVPARLRQLQTASPGELDLVLVIPGGGLFEREMHEAFGQRHSEMMGEWFAPESGVGLFLEAWEPPASWDFVPTMEALAAALRASSDQMFAAVADGEWPGAPAVSQACAAKKLEFIADRVRASLAGARALQAHADELVEYLSTRRGATA